MRGDPPLFGGILFRYRVGTPQWWAAWIVSGLLFVGAAVLAGLGLDWAGGLVTGHIP